MSKRLFVINEDEAPETIIKNIYRALRVAEEYDAEAHVVERDLQVNSGYNINYIDNLNGGRMRHITTIENGQFDEKHWIKNIFYRPLTESLSNKFPELAHINPSSILFMEDTLWKKPGNTPIKKCWIAQTKLTDQKIYALTGYLYIMTFRTWFIEKMSREQVICQLYHELRHIGKDGTLEKHDVDDWSNLVATLGQDWATTRSQISDILSDNFMEWDALHRQGGQVSLFDSRGTVKPQPQDGPTAAAQ